LAFFDIVKVSLQEFHVKLIIHIKRLVLILRT